ncbi:MAG: LysM peptidoglycan-binding domain-containing protein [Rhodocyclaceae bacterium]|nr:LysM peptidoglycan-binding domain-containing protein [Rhodocyclaceae bacterium]
MTLSLSRLLVLGITLTVSLPAIAEQALSLAVSPILGNIPAATPESADQASPQAAPAHVATAAESKDESTDKRPAESATTPAAPPAAEMPAAPLAPQPAAVSANDAITADAPLPVAEIAAPPSPPNAIDLTESPDELFERIRNGFAMPNLTGDLVLTQQQWYMNRPDYLRRMVERSSRYLHHIVEELERRGMPTELALLPMVESAFNPMAYSRARASGLWQFIPSTGRNYNLKQDWWKDERRDIVAATSAALDYLQTIYEMHGDWFLALASYNWGEGAVARAIKKNEAKGLPTDYQSLTMPAETRNYVPKLQALKNIFSNPQLVAALDLPAIPNRPYFATVTPSKNIDIKVAAKLADMPVQDFVALNPAHNRPVIQSETPLVIPAEKLETFQANLESHAEEEKPLSKWQTYTLAPGEKLEKVAPRFGITLADLKRVNGLTGRIKTPPTTLLVPASNGVGAEDMTSLPEQPRLPSADPAPAAKMLIVKKGETIGAVARRGGISVAELKRINRLKSDRVAPGMRLAVQSPTSAPTTASAAPAKAGKNANATKVTRYTVKRGDTLQSVARRFKVDHKDILRWNAGISANLKPGQQLIIQIPS